jgi:hypothetical protein
LIPLSSLAQNIKSWLEPCEIGQALYLNSATNEIHSRLEYEIRRVEDPKRTLYSFKRKAKGNFERFKNVNVLTEGLMEEKEGLLYLDKSRTIILDEANTPLLTIEKQFDYVNKKIYWTSFQGEKKKLRALVFPIKGHTADDIVLAYFLKPYVAYRTDKKFKSFYMLTNEPKLYKFNIKVIGEEDVSIENVTSKALKIKLIVDLGLAEDIVDKLVRPTYIWFQDSPPYHPMHYQGFETTPQYTYVVLKILGRQCPIESKELEIKELKAKPQKKKPSNFGFLPPWLKQLISSGKKLLPIGD